MSVILSGYLTYTNEYTENDLPSARGEEGMFRRYDIRGQQNHRGRDS